MTDPRSFGAWLKRERERRAITLRTIADRTKIGVGLLESLERGDVSRWPGGIYRRAFVRGYAETVGLDADLVIANFERVFPADPTIPSPAPATPSSTEAAPQELRLTLAVPTPTIGRETLKRIARDLAGFAGLGLVGYVIGGAAWFWCLIAIGALTLHVTHVLGVRPLALWNARSAPAAREPGQVRGEVVSFKDGARALSRRARARRLIADLSAAASSAAIPGRRRAARS